MQPGEYTVACEGASKKPDTGGWKIELRFRVIDGPLPVWRCGSGSALTAAASYHRKANLLSSARLLLVGHWT